jgi:hypothetical protein
MADNSADIAKRVILGAVAEGMTVEAATASAGKSIKTYEYYRRTDKIFTDKVDRTRLGLKDKQFASPDVHDLTLQLSAKQYPAPEDLSHISRIW